MRAQELLEDKDSIAFTFGRFNPPTIGHEKLVDAAKNAGASNYRVYVSQSQDPKKNPLHSDQKLGYLKTMFPGVKFQLAGTFLKIVTDLYDEGWKNVVLVVGSDRVADFERLLNDYNGGEDKPHGYYNFDSIEVKSAGQRDPDAEGAEGMSASKMRVAATEDDYNSFKKGLPSGFRGGEEMFNAIRKGMNLHGNNK